MARKHVIADTPQRTRRSITAALVCIILAVCAAIASGEGQAVSTRSVERVDNSAAPVRLAGQSSRPDFNERDSKSGGVGGRRLGSSPAAVCGEANLSKLTRLVYVSPQGVDGPTCGTTTTSACKTVHQGINNCTGSGCGVLVRYGLYPLSAAIQLSDGVSVYGSCVFDNSTSEPYRTMLQAPPDGKPAITASGINTATTLYGFVVLGSDATTDGQASIAMTVSSSKGLTISHTVLAAGKGADGASRGAEPQAGAGGPGGEPSAPDQGGEEGVACPSSLMVGSGNGGTGADINRLRTSACNLFDCTCHTSSTLDAAGKTGQASGKVKGGNGGGIGAGGCACVFTPHARPGDGGAGRHGNPGACGNVGGKAISNVWGTVNTNNGKFSNWEPVNGGAGESGAVGSGGGGGGSGGYAVFVGVSHNRLFDGRSGGGGGGGGCGGTGGMGGQQGGASIPLVLVGSSLNLIQNSYIPGPGGRGGNGGQGGIGGEGGPGAQGFPGHDIDIGPICIPMHQRVPGSGGPGGNGGQGGAGAGGAGGNGGPSIGIALVEGSPAPPSESGIYDGSPGTPGSKGKGGQNAHDQCQGADGSDGVKSERAFWHSF